ncbi:unnamed protein product [marine sediment metagenome]|uniref:Aconitase A/isopropylmalate dehydratase small subunit swivel domain-containing protein n=1 Tax=marine sediment metagenome TaxID=412755 RepID=X1SCI2_9ZZZZ
MKLQGSACKIGDHVNTDYIVAGKRKAFYSLKELANHILEDLDPDFPKKIRQGSFIVAGKNFGCGSSREEAPLVIKYAGINAVIAKSVARIFHRNAINIGLLVIECDTNAIDDKDQLVIDLENKTVTNKSKHSDIVIKSIPEIVLSILNEGGLVPYIRKYGCFIT